MTTATPAEYGAAYLDEHYPDWANRINLWQLDMGDPCHCIAGQRFSTAADGNGFAWFHNQHGDEFVARLGFDAPDDTPPELLHETFDCLTAEWSQLVASRQAQTTTTQTDPQEVTA